MIGYQILCMILCFSLGGNITLPCVEMLKHISMRVFIKPVFIKRIQ